MVCLLLNGSGSCQIIPDCEPDFFVSKESFSKLLHYENTRKEFYEEILKRTELSINKDSLLIADLGDNVNGIYQNFKVIDEDL